MAEVVLKGVRKAFGRIETIHDVDLTIRDGEFTVFVGPSGCGKSTLLRLIAGLEDITAGDLFMDGARVNNLPPKRRGVAMVFQSYALYPHMTVFQNMGFGLELAKAGAAEIDAKVRKAAEILELTPLLDRLPKQLSGGQRQRVAIGRAITREPKVFLFDEPLSNLDAALRVQTRIEIAKLHADLGATMIYVTHDQVEAMTLADKIVVLNAGRVEQVGSPLELYEHPANLFVAGFIGSPKMNFLPGAVESVTPSSVSVRLGGGGVVEARVDPGSARVGDKVTLGIRPEHIDLGSVDAGALSGVIEVVENLGECHFIYLRADDGGLVTIRGNGLSRHATKSPLTAAIPAAACHVFNADGRALRRRAGSSAVE